MYQVAGPTPPDLAKREAAAGSGSPDWLSIASEAYQQSTSYLDSNLRGEWVKALYAFQSRHAPDSKYNTDAFRHRSKIYRPKTRTLIRKIEAAACAAFFSNVDVLDARAVNEGDPKQLASAQVLKALVQYRLTKTIPWFMILMGGFQDASTMGAVCSYQYWRYRTERQTAYVQDIDPDTGQGLYEEDGQKPKMRAVKHDKVLEDRPCIELQPLENIRIDPAADWMDPIHSSPFVIRMVPMYVYDVKEMMETEDDKTGQPKWKKASDAVIRSALTRGLDATRMARQNRREDPTSESKVSLADFDIVWVHENFVRRKGKEWVYWTLGTEFMLTEPKELKEVYFHGMRPLEMGCAIIETHRAYKSGIPQLVEGIQRESNEVVNQRLDNVKLVLNKHYIVKRGAQVDLRSLVRNVPGGITMATNPESDVKEMTFNDVTSSSYQEQNLLNLDFDGIGGDFNPAQVPHNRKGADTVRGMQMMGAGASQMTEYLLRTVTVTWVERVLYQLIKLEQEYETDQVVLAIAAEKAQLLQRYGVDKVTDELLNHELTITVNVGMGATDPNAKLSKLISGLNEIGQIMANQAMPPQMKSEAVKEIFGLLGYPDAKRFLGDGQKDPQVAQLEQQLQQAQQVIQQLQQQIKNKAMDHDAKVKTAAINADSHREVALGRLATEREKQQHQTAQFVISQLLDRINKANGGKQTA
ncbi:hypothetical protein [Paraburkholderia sp. C35]|uniref:portal protein n=1 Tax=Paraburkholderia sp. C35 TaxID=2126993 RepID=UPI000D699FC6|nr:hypothetical protein [Paraburkholderia sp. C35]